MLFGRKAVLCGILVMSFMFTIAFIMYKPLSKMQIEAPPQSSKTYRTLPKNENNSYCKTAIAKVRSPSFRKLNFEKTDIPVDIRDKASSVRVESRRIKIGNDIIHYRTGKVVESKWKNPLSVLLLHGKAYSSKTWDELGTIKFITAFGLRAVAVDLPKHSKSYPTPIEKKNFLQKVIVALNLTKPVIVSPSFSGSFAIPYLSSHWYNVSALLAISPTGTSLLKQVNCGNQKGYRLDATCYSWVSYTEESFPDMSCIKVPVLILCGEKDETLSSSRLCRLPWSKGLEIPRGEHAAYLSNPELWHKILYNFLIAINKAYICEWGEI